MQVYTKLINRLKLAEEKRKAAEKTLLDNLVFSSWRRNKFIDAAITAEVHSRLKTFVDGLHPELCVEDEARLGEARICEMMLTHADDYNEARNNVFLNYQDADEAKLMFHVFSEMKAIFEYTSKV